MSEQFQLFQEFSITNWNTYQEFVNHINETYEEVYFQGEATVQKIDLINGKRVCDTFLFFKLNDSLYASIFKEDRDNLGSFFFDGISKMSEILLKSHEYLELVRRSSKNKFKDLGVKIPIDLKCYIYEDEQRIIMSQLNKVDMIYSQKMLLDEHNNFKFKGESSVSLNKLVDWYKFNAKTTERLKLLEENKKK